MSLHEYQSAIELRRADHPFYALIMAAMMRADSANAAKLQAAFPDVWQETYDRYWAPGGELLNDQKPRIVIDPNDPTRRHR